MSVCFHLTLLQSVDASDDNAHLRVVLPRCLLHEGKTSTNAFSTVSNKQGRLYRLKWEVAFAYNTPSNILS